MSIRDQICEYLEAELVVPRIQYRHQGRLHKQGKVDCLGVIIAVCRKFELTDWDCNEYSEQAFGYKLVEYGDLVAQPSEDLLHGDVLLFRISALPQHLGVYVGQQELVHAGQGFGVKRVPYDTRWQRRTIRTYRLPGV